MKRPKLISSETVLQGFVTVTKDKLLFDDAHTMDYFVIRVPNESVIVVALSPEGTFLVTREYRHAVGQEVYGFAGGLMDEGESPIQAAERELLEETGCSAEGFELLGSFYAHPGMVAQKISIVLARGVRKMDNARLDASEIITSAFYTKEALYDLLRKGYAADAAMLAALELLSIASVT